MPKVVRDKSVPAGHYILFKDKEFVGCILHQNLNQYDYDVIKANPKEFAEIKEKVNASTS